MAAIKAFLGLAATLVTLQACTHPSGPATAQPVPMTSGIRAAALGDHARARTLIQAKFAESRVTNIVLDEPDEAGRYPYVCYFDRDEYGKRCLYTARGFVDLKTNKVSARRKLDFCLDPQSK